MTEAIPFSLAAADEYISLCPLIWPLDAFSTKWGGSPAEILRSKLASSAARFLTDSMPPLALAWV